MGLGHYVLTRIQTGFLLISCLLCTYHVHGQTTGTPPHDDEGFCRAEQVHEKRMLEDDIYRKGYLKHSRMLDSVLMNPLEIRSAQPPQYTVPIVVHIIHLGEAVGEGSNISDDQVHAAIDGLNDRYANAVGMGLDIEIDFCLATRAPDGCATTGILRVDGSEVANYADDGIEYDNCGADEQEIKDLSRWSTADYYNVWVVHDICGNYGGYAYYPNGGPYDGTVIVDNSMVYNSRTLAHELGHGLNLRHTFNGDNDGDDCPLNDDCLTQGDRICDTPPHKRGDCGASNPCMGGGTWENSRYNYMSYCGTPLALGRFTSDQKDRMRAAIEVFPRSSLLNSEGCDTPIQGEILSSDDPMCPGDERTLEGFPDGEFDVISGPGDISGNTLTALEEGTIVIEFVSCGGILQQEIIVYPAPDPEITSDNSPMCVEEVRVLSAIPAGGVFEVLSGPGLIDGNTLIALGSGLVDVIYTVAENDCEGETFTSIDIFDNPDPFFENDDSGMCVGDDRVLLAQPPGGQLSIASGPGTLNGDVLSADSAGLIIVEYSVIENGCLGVAAYSVETDTLPDVAITVESDTICFDEMATLIIAPPGGNFNVVSGPGVIDSGFLSLSGFGTAVIVYSFSQNGCSASDTVSVTVVEDELPQLMSADTNLCVGDTSLLFTSPEGGMLSVLSGSAQLFENMVFTTDAGPVQLEYRTCAGADTQTVAAYSVPDPMILSSGDPMCAGDSRVLEVSVPDGDFSVDGPGALNGSILQTIGGGTLSIEYIVTENGCTGSTQQIIEVQEPEEVVVTLDESVLTANNKNAEFQWVDCENQYEPVPGETEQSFIVTSTGQYALISTQGVCIDTSECIEVVLTGIEDPSGLSNVRIMPNPANGMFVVILQDYRDNIHISVRDILGHQIWQTLHSGESLTVDLTGVPSGVYVVEIRQESKSVVKKVVLR